MKFIPKISLIFLVLILTSCFESETFTDAPQIEFNSVLFVDVDDGGQDSLYISFDFTDENGDIGLSSDENEPPYHSFNIVLDSRDSLVKFGSESIPPFYSYPVTSTSLFEQTLQDDGTISINEFLAFVYFPSDKVLLSELDTRPTFFDCDLYQTLETPLFVSTGGNIFEPQPDFSLGDTLYVVRNEFFFNLLISFEKQEGDDFVPINFQEIFNSNDCDLGNFDARIPLFDQDGRIGTITYGILSLGFDVAFADDLIRVKIYIYDRALNKSNEVYSEPFFLRDITI